MGASSVSAEPCACVTMSALKRSGTSSTAERPLRTAASVRFSALSLRSARRRVSEASLIERLKASELSCRILERIRTEG